jgi:uncharacterized protein (TIGR02145 family)
MKKLIEYTAAIIVIANVILMSGCKKEKVPVITTTEVTNIGAITATSGGTVTNEGTSTVLFRGVCWSTLPEPTIKDNKTSEGTGAGSFSSNLVGLDGATNYYVRAYATNSVGTGYGLPVYFTTLGQQPSSTISAATKVNMTSVTLNGSVNANYLSTVVTFEYGTTTSYGNSVNATQSPVTGNTVTVVSTDITGLTATTLYHFRIKSVNSLGTTYSGELSFTTTTLPQTFDVDGNSYSQITIGTQVWLKENLKTTKYNDGTAIPVVTDNTQWSGLTTGAYSWYNNDESSYKSIYGALYNWYAASSGKLCPTGWHTATDAEFTTLTNFLGGTSVAGGKMKEIGDIHWNSPNTGATNESGFTAVPAGSRSSDGLFQNLGTAGFWWTSTPYNTIKSYYWGVSNINTINNHWYGVLNQAGFSVRCVKN